MTGQETKYLKKIISFKKFLVFKKMTNSNKINNISFWCVNYNDYMHTDEFIKSVLLLKNINNCNIKIIVIDNSIERNGFEYLKEKYNKLKNINIIFSGHNYGYFGAFNYLLNGLF